MVKNNAGVSLLYGANIALVGKKAANLIRATESGKFSIPTGFAFEMGSPGKVPAIVNFWKNFRKKLLDIKGDVIVRSSGGLSMPGMLDSIVVPRQEQMHQKVYDAVLEVSKSWNNERACIYRDSYFIPHDFDMGVVVQQYVEIKPTCCAGVILTRNPKTGLNIVVEAVKGQPGSVVVNGEGTPRDTKIGRMLHNKLSALAAEAESLFKGPQDLEFVTKNNNREVLLVQARDFRNYSPTAARIIAATLLARRIIDTDRAKELLKNADYKAPWYYVANASVQPAFSGYGAVPGAVTGYLSIGPVDNDQCIYVCEDTGVEHVPQMLLSKGILSSMGGQSSHAAMIAANAGKPCVVGAGFVVDYTARVLTVGDRVFKHGDAVTIDGATGAVYDGFVDIEDLRTKDL